MAAGPPPPSADQLQAELKMMVGDELQSVSYKHLARKHNLHVDVAKAALFAFAERAGAGAVAAEFFVSGYRAADGVHVARVVPAADLDAARAELDPVTAVHCFSVAPASRTGGSSAAAVWGGDAAQEAELFEAVLAGQDNALADGRCSAVECPDVERVKRAAPAAAETKPPPPPPMPAAKPVAAAPKPAATKKGGIAAAIKKSAKPAPKRAAPAAADGSDSDGPVARGGGSRRAAARLESSDDEDEPAAVAADPYEEAVPSPSPAAAAAATAGGAAPKKRKVTRTIINDDGEEVTEEVWEDGGEAAAAPPPPPPKPTPKKRASPKGPVQPAKTQTKADAAKGTKNIASFFTKKAKK